MDLIPGLRIMSPGFFFLGSDRSGKYGFEGGAYPQGMRSDRKSQKECVPFFHELGGL
jgi:hypothetical protein